MKYRLLTLSLLLVSILISGLLVFLIVFDIEYSNTHAFLIEGISIISILICLFITIKYKLDKILTIGWHLVLAGSFMGAIDEFEYSREC